MYFGKYLVIRGGGPSVRLRSFSVILMLSMLIVTGTPAKTFAGYPVRVDAPVASEGTDRFHYDVEAGTLFRKEANRFIELKSFGRIPNLLRHQIQVHAVAIGGPADQKAGAIPLVLIRHGHWLSVIDPISDKLIMGNIGPIDVESHNNRYNKVLRSGDQHFVVFSGTTAVNGGQTRQMIFFLDAKECTIGWLPIRNDEVPENVKIELTNDGKIAFQLTYYDVRVTKTGHEPVQSILRMLVDTKSRKVTEMRVGNEAAHSLLTRDKIDSTRETANSIQGMFAPEVLMSEKRLRHPAASAKYLEETGNPNDPKAREIALNEVRSRIDAALSLEARIRESMKFLKGQEEAIKGLVSFAQRSVDATKFPVIAIGGPTGTGKTSGVHAYAKGIYPDKTEPVFELSLSNQTEKAFLQTALFGSAPGYIGSGDPTALMLWMLKNHESGILFFDELDKAPLPALNILLEFLEKGVVRISPQLVAALVKSFEQTPIDEWPKPLRDITDGGKKNNVELVLKLTPRHQIILGTNAGSGIFHGADGSSVAGRRLKSDEELRAANARFTGQTIKDDLRAKGLRDEWLARISAFIPFKVIMPEDHKLVVADIVERVRQTLQDQYRVKLEIGEAAMTFLKEESYSPLDGARWTINSIEAWLDQTLRTAIFAKSVGPGDHLEIVIEPGSSTKRAVLHFVKKENKAELAQFDVGKPLPPRPDKLLKKARERLQATLEKRIVGHREEIKLVTESIISELTKATYDPTRQGRPIVVYFDGPPGVGKTELAKAVAEALFDDASSLQRVNMNEISTIQGFYDEFVQRMKSSVKTSPESLVALLDELPRMGDPAYGTNKSIQKLLMSVFDEGVLPGVPGERKTVGDREVSVNEATTLPPATIFLCTGNLFVKALGEGATERMTIRELHAYTRLIARHPERFKAVYAEAFEDAFRSRLGEPILFAPSTEEEMATIRDGFFTNAVQILKTNGVAVELSDSAKSYFEKYKIAIRGNRWTRAAMEKYVEAPLNTRILGNLEKYKDSKLVVTFDEKSMEMSVEVWRDDKLVTTELLSTLPRAKSDYHEEAKNRTAWKTAVHEAGHAIVRRVLYGKGSVAEINVFGGGEGGWMEKDYNTPEEDMYLTTKKGPYEIAVSLAGHIAEIVFLKNAANGASADFDSARRAAETMIINGSTLGLAPLPLVTNPSTGKVEMSQETIRELEFKQKSLMDFASRLALHIIKTNSDTLLKVAQTLSDSKDMNIDKHQFEAVVDGKLIRPEEKVIKKMILADRGTRAVCQDLLIDINGVSKLGWWKSFWQKVVAFFR